MASLLLTGAEADAHIRKRSLYLATLDTQKASDVIDHTILLNKLYEEGVDQNLTEALAYCTRNIHWSYSEKLKIKWKSDMSNNFGMFHGVKQSGILSTHFYKVYVNGFLVELRMNSIGNYIGCIYAGCPACANDVLFMTEDPEELQVMLAIAKSYSGGHRFIVHSQKTKVVCKDCATTVNDKVRQKWSIGGNVLHLSDSTTHLGLVRTDKNDCGGELGRYNLSG